MGGWLLGLAQSCLGLGAGCLCRPPRPARRLGAGPLEPRPARLDLDSRPLALIATATPRYVAEQQQG